MPRPRKCRRVCLMPPEREFVPTDYNDSVGKEDVLLLVDEYECIRLIDKLHLSQEECACRMQVSRSTVQLIYDAARYKLATAITEGRRIRIAGGDFRLCDGGERRCAPCRRKCEGGGCE